MESRLTEEIWVKVNTNNVKIVLCCVYVPPASSSEAYQRHCDATEEVIESHKDFRICIAGNYNSPKTNWSNDHMGVNVEDVTSAV